MKKLTFEKIIPDNESSFKATIFEEKYFSSPLHFHPEFEIILIEKGDGLCFCGDYVGRFQPAILPYSEKDCPTFT